MNGSLSLETPLGRSAIRVGGLAPREVLMTFFAWLAEVQIPYCVVGNSDSLPDLVAGDVDIVVPHGDWTRFPRALDEFCERSDTKLTQCLQHEQTALYFVISWEHNDSSAFLALDACSDYFRGGRLMLEAGEILADRIPAVDRCGRSKGFFVPKPANEFQYYLLKKVDKAVLSDEQARHLSDVWRADPEGARAAISRFWPAEWVEIIARAAESADWDAVRKSLPRLRRSLRRGLRRQPVAYLGAEFQRWMRRFLAPTGFLVAFLGPDGSGKSTVIREVTAAVAPAFRRALQFHLLPKHFSSQTRAEVVDPHGLPPRPALESAIKLVYFLLVYHFGWWRRVRPALVRSTFVAFDRYFHDILLDGLRYRFRGPRWLARLVARAIPQPDLWIVLDAPIEVLRSRKVELSAEACARLRERYVAFARGRTNALLVDASRPLPEVTATVAREILSALSTRTRKRLGIRP